MALPPDPPTRQQDRNGAIQNPRRPVRRRVVDRPETRLTPADGSIADTTAGVSASGTMIDTPDPSLAGAPVTASARSVEFAAFPGRARRSCASRHASLALSRGR